MIRFAFLVLVAATAGASAHDFSRPVPAGELQSPPRLETSGLAISRRTPNVLWTHDDSGGAAALYAVKTTGERIGVLWITGTKNEDWEDVASYELDGKAWLLIADTGDNDAKRGTVQVHLVEEPPIEHFKGGGELSAKPARTLRIRYEDGSRDCESVAVDRTERAIYLLTKRDALKRLYRVELAPKDPGAIVIARHVGIAQVVLPTEAEKGIKGYLGRRRAETTAMDFTADGSAAIVLTYGDLYYYARKANEPWANALARAPEVLPGHNIIQAEAACFSADGKQIYVAAEGNRTLLRYDRR